MRKLKLRVLAQSDLVALDVACFWRHGGLTTAALVANFCFPLVGYLNCVDRLDLVHLDFLLRLHLHHLLINLAIEHLHLVIHTIADFRLILLVFL